jgi:hypothetical protein
MEVVTLNEMSYHCGGLVKGHSLSHVADLIRTREGSLEDGPRDAARRWRRADDGLGHPIVEPRVDVVPIGVGVIVTTTIVITTSHLLPLPTHAPVRFLVFPVLDLKSTNTNLIMLGLNQF